MALNRLRRNRRLVRRSLHCLTMSAAIVMASAYFMPAMACNPKPRVNPSQEVRHFVKDEMRSLSTPATPPGSMEDWLSCFAVYLSPYLFALLVAIGALGRLLTSLHLQRMTAWLTLLLFFAAAWSVILCAILECEMWDGDVCFSLRDSDFIVCLLLPLALVFYACWVMRLKERALLCLAFAGTCCCVAWWDHWLDWTQTTDGAPDPQYGLYCSTTAAAILALSVVRELSCLTGRHPLRALGMLLLGWVPFFVRDDGCCPRCGYCLISLSERRCPECGRPFTMEETGLDLLAIAGPSPKDEPGNPLDALRRLIRRLRKSRGLTPPPSAPSA